MKRWLKVLIIVLAVLLILAAGFTVWQWNNIVAMYTAFTRDEQVISQQIEQANKQQEEKLSEYDITVKPIDTGQTEALLSGEASPEDVKEALGITAELEKEAPPVKSEGKTEKNETVPQKPKVTTVSDLVNKCTAELYSIEVDLMAQLGVMKKEALSKWKAIPKDERRKDILIQIGLDGLNRCYDLEDSADKQVKDVLAKYRTPIKNLGGDTKILDQMWKQYCDKKASKKAYYINKYIK